MCKRGIKAAATSYKVGQKLSEIGIEFFNPAKKVLIQL